MRFVALTTEEFWDTMCKPKFVRLSLLSGVIENTIYTCLVAPEQTPGFMQKKINDVMALLGVGPLECTTKGQR